MSTFLDRAKAKAHQSAATTDVWIKLDLLQGLIAEIEALQAEAGGPLKPVVQLAQERAKKEH